MVSKLLLRHTPRIPRFGNAIFGSLRELVSKIFDSLRYLVIKLLPRHTARIAHLRDAIFGRLCHIATLAQFWDVFLCLNTLCVYLANDSIIGYIACHYIASPLTGPIVGNMTSKEQAGGHRLKHADARG